MSVTMIFEESIPLSEIDKIIHPPEGGLGVTLSTDNPGLNRHDITMSNSNGVCKITIDGLTTDDLSSQTEQALIDAVPATHIDTVDK